MNRTQITIFISLLAAVVISFLFSDHSYILTAPLSGRLGDGYAIVTHEAEWSPGREQITRAKEDARVFLAEKLKDQATTDYTKKQIRQILARWPRYRFQVFCRIDSGRKIMHLNFMPKGGDEWMENQLIRVRDGGPSFWWIDFDSDARKIIRLEINGFG